MKAGNPWIRGVERLNTTRPQDYQPRIDAALAQGEPVIAYLNGEHYVVITGREVKGGKVVYRINDPWAVTAGDGQGIALEDNLLHKGGFDAIRQLVFVTAQEYAPTNGIPVSAVLSPTYSAYLGPQVPGQPVPRPRRCRTAKGCGSNSTTAPSLARRAPSLPSSSTVWEKYRADGGIAKFGVPVAGLYSYWSVRRDRGDAKAGGHPLDGRGPCVACPLLTPANAFLAEYFANPDLSGAPVYRRLEEDLLFDWQGAGPWVKPDGFAARFTGTFQVGGLGWRYNFMAAADNGVRAHRRQSALDTWTSPSAVQGLPATWAGANIPWWWSIATCRATPISTMRSAWPATAVFAAEAVVSPADRVPARRRRSCPTWARPSPRHRYSASGVGHLHRRSPAHTHAGHPGGGRRPGALCRMGDGQRRAVPRCPGDGAGE